MKIFPGGFLDKVFNPEIAFITNEESNLLDNFIIRLCKDFNLIQLRRTEGSPTNEPHIFRDYAQVRIDDIYTYKYFLFEGRRRDGRREEFIFLIYKKYNTGNKTTIFFKYLFEERAVTTKYTGIDCGDLTVQCKTKLSEELERIINDLKKHLED